MKNASSNISVEEILNSCTHGIGLVLSIAGFVVLLALSIRHGTAWHIAGCAIYGSTLICLYLASTVYHGVPLPRFKRILKIFDHSAIYLLIAGTYTPFLLVNLRGGWGWSLLGIVWGCAMAGIIFKVWFVDHFKVLSTVLYLVLGWLILVAAKPLGWKCAERLEQPMPSRSVKPRSQTCPCSCVIGASWPRRRMALMKQP
ncbi:MAG: hemolysin III family protein [Candidatus Sulfotelmatobacter sp.]